MDVQVMEGNFNYLIAPWNLLYSVIGFDFSYSILYCSIRSSVPAQATRAQFCTHTNSTHVTPLSLCKYTLFPKSEDHLFMQSVHLR